MFAITDEFLAQAGFTSLSDEQKEVLRGQVTQSVQNKIGDRIASHLGEELASELAALMDGSAEEARSFLGGVDANYQDSDTFKRTLELSLEGGASEDDVVKEYAVLVWMQRNQVPVAEIVQESMNDAMVELRAIYQQVAEAVNNQDNISGE